MVAKKRARKNRHTLLKIAICIAIVLLALLYPGNRGEGYSDNETTGNDRLGMELAIPQFTKSTKSQVIEHIGYTVSYNEQRRNPNWVAYELTAAEVDGTEPRGSKFIPDPEVRGRQAVDDDYRNSGWDRGNDPGIIKSFRQLPKRIMLLPVATILGTWSALLIVNLLLEYRTAGECYAVGSGFGYYSLSSIFITEYKGVELGTLALLSNIARELMALLAAPLLVKQFGPLSLISAGGATTMDTVLPSVIHHSGKQYTIISIYHGFVVDFCVPFMVTFFCTI